MIEVFQMYDINSYKHVIVDYTNEHNDKDYLMGYLERLHDLKIENKSN